jgi:hypothetical protein
MLIRLLRHRGVTVALVVCLYLMTAPVLPLVADQGLYAISLTIKDLLLWTLPLSVALFIAHAIASFEKNAPLFLITLLLFEIFSNGSSVWFAYGCGSLVGEILPPLSAPSLDAQFEPLWQLPWIRPSWWSPDKGSGVGVVIGFIAAFAAPRLRSPIAHGKHLAEWILTRVFSRLIPLFIVGFVARMHRTGLFHTALTRYANLILWLIAIWTVYLFFLFWVGSEFSIKQASRSGKNLLPAAGIALSSSCSLSTLPWTIEGAGKNLRNPELAKAIIPATTNIQQIGDCIANAFLAFLVYRHFFGAAPPLSLWIPFSTVFVLSRFATAAVLGGALFIMLPIYESFLSFTPEMIGIMIAFNVILDPLITCANVVGNAALCKIFERVWNWTTQVLYQF